MIKGLLGKKIGMTQIFKEAGEIVPVTVIEAGPCTVLQVKSTQKEGYIAVQLGFDNKKKANKPDAGRFKKAKSEPLRFVKEIKADSVEGIKPSDKITVDMFTVGDYVDISGTSIGKGFQGGVKRWNWRGGPKSHGSMQHRAPGSIGASSDPSRVFKGQHLPGHMGNAAVTVQHLEVVEIDKENNLLLVKGGVPGAKGNYLYIMKALKKAKKKKKVETRGEEKKINPLKQAKKSMKR